MRQRRSRGPRPGQGSRSSRRFARHPERARSDDEAILPRPGYGASPPSTAGGPASLVSRETTPRALGPHPARGSRVRRRSAPTRDEARLGYDPRAPRDELALPRVRARAPWPPAASRSERRSARVASLPPSSRPPWTQAFGDPALPRSCTTLKLCPATLICTVRRSIAPEDITRVRPQRAIAS